MNLTTNGQRPGTVLSVGIALSRYRPMGLNTCRLELHQLQKLNIIHKRMAHFFPGRFLEYAKRSRSFVSTYLQPAWWHALKSLYHMADEEDLFSVDWYLMEMADRWDVRNPGGWREKIPETELFLCRLPVALYGFCDHCDNDDIMQYPPLRLMRGLLSLEWRTHHGSAAAIIDEYDLGEEIKQQAREASLGEIWHRLAQLE